jgi:hypothetical protein
MAMNDTVVATDADQERRARILQVSLSAILPSAVPHCLRH